jgi:hypothetical protein
VKSSNITPVRWSKIYTSISEGRLGIRNLLRFNHAVLGNGFGGSFVVIPDLRLGDGSKVRFWHDLWFWDTTLKEAFPNLFGIACQMMLLLRLIWNF